MHNIGVEKGASLYGIISYIYVKNRLCFVTNCLSTMDVVEVNRKMVLGLPSIYTSEILRATYGDLLK